MIDSSLYRELRQIHEADDAREIYIGLKHSLSEPKEHLEHVWRQLEEQESINYPEHEA